MLLLGPGQFPRELAEIAGADQLAPRGVAAWRHCPPVTGDAATPDQPSRVLASQPPEPGILAGSGPAGIHGETRRPMVLREG